MLFELHIAICIMLRELFTFGTPNKYLKANIERLSRIVAGRTSAGVECAEERAALALAEQMLKGMCND